MGAPPRRKRGPRGLSAVLSKIPRATAGVGNGSNNVSCLIHFRQRAVKDCFYSRMAHAIRSIAGPAGAPLGLLLWFFLFSFALYVRRPRRAVYGRPPALKEDFTRFA